MDFRDLLFAVRTTSSVLCAFTCAKNAALVDDAAWPRGAFLAASIFDCTT